MRRLTLLLVIALMTIPAAARADDPALELRWHLDDYASADFGVDSPDSSGRGHTANVPTEASGAFTGGAEGAGTVAPEAGDPSTPAQPTVMIWVRHAGVPVAGSEGWIVADGVASDCTATGEQVPYGLHVATDGSVDFRIRQSSTTSAASPAAGSLQLWDGMWHALAGVYDGSKVHLYLDGNEVGTGTDAAAIADSGGFFSTAKLTGCDANRFTGAYDEVRLYDRALSPAEIGYLQASPLGPAPRALPVPPSGENVSARLPLDEIGAGNSTPDVSGHSNDGTNVQASIVTGRYGNAFTFPNNASGFQIPESADLHPQRFTVSTWVNYTPQTNDHSKDLVGWGAGDAAPRRCSSHAWSLRLADDDSSGHTAGVQFYVNLFTPDGGQAFVTPPTVPAPTVLDGTWHNVTATYAHGTAQIYLDGSLVGSATVPAADVGASGVPGEVDYGWRYPFRTIGVGTYPDSSCALQGFRFPGSLDDIRIYDRALTDSEIQAIATAGTPAPDPAETPEPTATATVVASPSPSPSPSPTRTPVATPSPTPVPTPHNVDPPVLREYKVSGNHYTDSCRVGSWDGIADPPQYKAEIWRYDPFALKPSQRETLVTASPPGLDVTLGDPSKLYFCRVYAKTPDGGWAVADSNAVLVPQTKQSALGLTSTLDDKPTGDFRIRGIDVFQVTQPNNGAGQFGFPQLGGFSVRCGGGTPTGLLPSHACDYVDANSQKATYSGVTMDAEKPTGVVVYVDLKPGTVRAVNEPLIVRLHGYSPKRLDATLKQTVNSGDLQSSPTDAVTAEQRGDERFGVHFTLPQSWLDAVTYPTNGTFDLDAKVSVEPGHADAVECKSSYVNVLLAALSQPCAGDDTYSLTDIPARYLSFRPVIQTLALVTSGQSMKTFNSPQSVLQSAQNLFPGGENWVIEPFAAQVNIVPSRYTATSDDCPGAGDDKDAQATSDRIRNCASNHVFAQMLAWMGQGARISVPGGGFPSNSFGYNILVGVHRYSTADGVPEPGVSTRGGIGNFNIIGGQPMAHLDDGTLKRFLTADAHELGHVFGAPHAGRNHGAAGDPSCKGDTNGQHGEAWPPNDDGRLEGVLYNAGQSATLTDADTPPVKYTTAKLYDFMSYCASEGDAWLSPYNWNRFMNAMIGLESTRRSARIDATTSGTGFVTGAIESGTAVIESTVAAAPGNDVPAADPSSAIRIRAYDAGGKSLGEVGARVLTSTEGGGGTFEAPLPAGTARVELVDAGKVVDQRAQGKPPTVKLAAPGRHTHARKALDVRWTATDPDTKDLTATVRFSADGGKTWRMISMGPSTGRATLPAELLAASRNARVQVEVSDGFSTATAMSARFRADGTPPSATIVRPAVGETIQAGQKATLMGHGLDDGRRLLTGRALTWFAGKRRLGTGAKLTRRLPAGKTKLRLVARDRHGRRTVVARTVRVTAPPLEITALRPAPVRSKARHTTVRVATSAAAIFRGGGRRTAVGSKPRKIRISLPKTPRAGIVRVPLRITPRRGGGAITTTLIVLRG